MAKKKKRMEGDRMRSRPGSSFLSVLAAVIVAVVVVVAVDRVAAASHRVSLGSFGTHDLPSALVLGVGRLPSRGSHGPERARLWGG